MPPDLSIPGVDVDAIALAIRDADERHHQNVPLREDMQHEPVGCSCGLTYSSSSPWDEARQHLLQVRAHAAVMALRRPCEVCMGSGALVRLGEEYECAECSGAGRVLTPLPVNEFCDEHDHIWVVDGIEESAAGLGRAWVRRV